MPFEIAPNRQRSKCPNILDYVIRLGLPDVLHHNDVLDCNVCSIPRRGLVHPNRTRSSSVHFDFVCFFRFASYIYRIDAVLGAGHRIHKDDNVLCFHRFVRGLILILDK